MREPAKITPRRLQEKVQRELHGRSLTEAATDLRRLVATQGVGGIVDRMAVAISTHRHPPAVGPLEPQGPQLHERAGDYAWRVPCDPYLALTPKILDPHAER